MTQILYINVLNMACHHTNNKKIFFKKKIELAFGHLILGISITFSIIFYYSAEVYFYAVFFYFLHHLSVHCHCVPFRGRL